ncbi:hypothetical protein BDV25DRAFT_139564 [Aspergillus avenaceus]|uniref:Short chain dehydrogenase/reductase n=1 Tax=Aspergillus avenaceus TaxID=36643 RepID=A0A5N6TWW0_ASPAV|nr:hypothetical protein BDV25DRAFT_139564 [Aspergillus avenaceus]
MTRQKTVLITGCTPGSIGYALVREFQSRDYHVIATVRNTDLVPELTSQGMTALALDITDSMSIAQCREQVGRITENKLDILINNAGRGLVTPAVDTDLADARAVYETNLFGVIATINAFIDILIPAKGLIVNISSASALIPYVFGSVYSSSKAALAAYSRTLREELKPVGVRVQVVMAGTVRSNMGKAVKGELAEGSLYEPVRHLYLARRGYSQKEGSRPMETGEFARRVVDCAVRDEVGGFWRVVGFGRQDWVFEGGMARLVGWGSWVGEWVVVLVCGVVFGLGGVKL